MLSPKLARLTRAASFHPVSGGAVVYDARGNRLFALNLAAASVWLSLMEGASFEDARGALETSFGVDSVDARQWVASALEVLETLADTETEPLAGGAHPFAEQANTEAAAGVDYRVLGQSVRIDVPEAALSWTESLLGKLRARRQRREPPALALAVRIVGEEAELWRGEERLAAGPVNRLAGEIEQAIIGALVPQAGKLLAFHAAILKRGSSALLLPAPSGSGKTTLSATLATDGWAYGSDEMAFFGRDQQWSGLPFPPCIKAENYGRVESLNPALVGVPEHHRFGRQIKYLPIVPEQFSAPVSTVVFPVFGQDSEMGIEMLDPLTGLQRLLNLCVYVPPGFSGADVETLLRWHESVQYFSLSFHDAREASTLLAERFAAE